MKFPKSPPPMTELLAEALDKGIEHFSQIRSACKNHSVSSDPYPHWDKLQHLPTPDGLTHKEWWLSLKFERGANTTHIPLKDTKGSDFSFTTIDFISEKLHEIDLAIGGSIRMPEQITNPATKDKYYVDSLIEEAITSSQLEGATTTRKVASNMIRAGREPSDRSEKMILNNYRTMRFISENKNTSLSKELIFEIHRIVTEDTLEDNNDAGRFRLAEENIVVADDSGDVFHRPPHANELEQRMEVMCKFANKKSPNQFIHPALRAITLHFWLAYDHPFVDGNGRTARALFYWAMLHYKYWLCEFLSISQIILKGPAKYYRAFLHTETDENDLTYFLVYHLQVLRESVISLQAHIKKESEKVRSVEKEIKNLEIINHRQRALLSHALRHPNARYTARSHQVSHGIANQTARTDLIKLSKLGFLESKKIGKQVYFDPVANLREIMNE